MWTNTDEDAVCLLGKNIDKPVYEKDKLYTSSWAVFLFIAPQHLLPSRQKRCSEWKKWVNDQKQPPWGWSRTVFLGSIEHRAKLLSDFRFYRNVRIPSNPLIPIWAFPAGLKMEQWVSPQRSRACFGCLLSRYSFPSPIPIWVYFQR